MLKRFTIPVILVIVVASAGLLAASRGITPRPLSRPLADRLVDLQRRPASAGEQIYEGQIYGLDGRASPLFRYERRVQDVDGAVTSTHITRDPAGVVVVVQSAVHTPDYVLQRADLIHGQSGVSASVTVANGEATFRLRDGQREMTATERVKDPVVAGPTMFGFILEHWDQLALGASLPIRFAVLERGESIGFVLDAVPSPAGRTIVRLRPSSLLVRLAVSPTYFHFDTASRRVLEYTGRVPPLQEVDGRLTTLDARVVYTFRTAAFR